MAEYSNMGGASFFADLAALLLLRFTQIMTPATIMMRSAPPRPAASPTQVVLHPPLLTPPPLSVVGMLGVLTVVAVTPTEANERSALDTFVTIAYNAETAPSAIEDAFVCTALSTMPGDVSCAALTTSPIVSAVASILAFTIKLPIDNE